MNLDTAYSLFEKLDSDNLCFGYQGHFNDEITNRVIDLNEENISHRGELTSMKKKVSFLMAECFQNIVRHGESTAKKIKKKVGKGLFLTRNIGDSFLISSANLIENSEISSLKIKLDQVNSLGKDELKSLYLDILQNEGISNKGGAGLGLIEMARKSGQKLEFHFEKYDENFSFFYLQICLQKKDAQKIRRIPIKEAIGFHVDMKEHNVLLIHKGNYSQDSIMPILTMIEDNLHSQSEQTIVKKRVYHIMVEILQNISLHSFGHDGIKQGLFLVGKQNGNYVISAGNFIESKKVKKFSSQLEAVAELDRPALKEMYLDKLIEERQEHINSAGLGLIDIARESSDNLRYKFYKVDDERHFFVLSVRVSFNMKKK
ncbi:MAG: hypothetical protein C0594_01485 [Marinilabiliales bacterium]|nr:MAG: hypothetical protein C0594_01485 [Marinilabiliales bacterium]